MQHGVSGKVDGHLENGWGLVNKTLLVMGVGIAALIVTYICYMVLVAAFVLWA